LNHGEIDGIAPKLAIVMIGTNNTGARRDPPEETAAGIQAIISTLRTGLPDTMILLLGVFPRGVSAEDPLRQVTVAVNKLVHTYADNQQVFFLDLSQIFLDNQGRLSQHLMPDYLHPMNRGIRSGQREWRTCSHGYGANTSNETNGKVEYSYHLGWMRIRSWGGLF
jgi:beta-glucosidase